MNCPPCHALLLQLKINRELEKKTGRLAREIRIKGRHLFPRDYLQQSCVISLFSSSSILVDVFVHNPRLNLLFLSSVGRVSFGSSKGSMVETLIYESPLSEHEPTPFGWRSNKNHRNAAHHFRTAFTSTPLPEEAQLLLPG